MSWPASGQRINNTSLYRTISSEKYFRLYYENDYFSTTDKYYTQGINVEYVHPALKKFFLTDLLLTSSKQEMKIGLSLEQEGYTPTSIEHSEILIGDRPFAGCLFFKVFSMVNNPKRKSRISSSFSFGAIGPVTGAKEIQQGIHKLIHYIDPKGWENQIKNDLILNYQVDVERSLFSYENYLSVSGKAGVRAGTFNTKAQAGFVIMTGYYDNPYTSFFKTARKTQVYLYAEPILNVVGYDATLQGGLFNKTSPYVIGAEDIERLVFQGTAGLVFKIRTVYLEYFQSYLTKEFKTGNSHVWGGFRVGWYLHP